VEEINELMNWHSLAVVAPRSTWIPALTVTPRP